jgi:predicted O-linked N-acetylglucosamine transferase (SPINDLY family)
MIPLSELVSQAAEWEQSGFVDRACELYRKALHRQPGNPELWARLGRGHCALGRFNEAVTGFRQAVRLRPEFAEAWLDLGKSLRSLGRRDEAAACCERAVQLRPDDPDPLNELGIVQLQRGELEAAVACFGRALRLRPDCGEAHSNLGLAYLGQGRPDEASLSFEQALSLLPDVAGVRNNLGLALLNQGRPHEAQGHFQEAIRRDPGLADAHNNLGLSLDAQGNLDDALACYARALQIDPEHHGAFVNLGNACKDTGLAAEAVALYRNALELRPDDASVHSNLLLAMQYLPTTEGTELLNEAIDFAHRHSDPLAAKIEPHPTLSQGRRMRIGYVSADFREHPVQFFLEPILAAHDHTQFEICAYADVPSPDAVTERLRGYADHWRSLAGLSDAHAAELIRRDGIDILVDLNGHTGGNRLLVFARKPAPIQASYLGYLGTTGLSTVDYYLTDGIADPPGQTEAQYRERLVRLPDCGFCYLPGPAPEVSPEPPVRRSNTVTFGCLNNPAKLTDEVLDLWSKLLTAVPGSRLLVATGGRRLVEERIGSIMARHAISLDRLRFAERSETRFDYLAGYEMIDVSLDPFPYNGVTTTCDSLWMGVPVISLAGRRNVSRQGVRFLRSLDLDDLLADSPEDYIRIGVDLATDLPRLAGYRAGLRERMVCSPLMNSEKLTRGLEAAYLWMREEYLGVQGSSREP